MDMYDLNVPNESSESKLITNSLKNTLYSAAKLEYGVVATAVTIPTQDAQHNKKDKNKMKSLVPFAPPPLKLDEHMMSALRVRSKQFKQISRVNFVLSDGSETHKMRQDNAQSYDLLAVQPTTEKMFHMACTKLEVDIISPDMTEKLPFYFKRLAVNAAIERGIYFEIPYAPAIRDSSVRKSILTNALALVRVCKGKNVIITSQARKPIEMRGPYDVANLGLVFGLTQQQAKNAVSTNCRAVIFHAATRRNTAKSVMSIQLVGDLSAQEQWKVKAGQEASGAVHADRTGKSLKEQQASGTEQSLKEQQPDRAGQSLTTLQTSGTAQGEKLEQEGGVENSLTEEQKRKRKISTSDTESQIKKLKKD